MRNYQRVLIDGNAILNSTLLRGVDHDAGVVKVNEQGKKITVNSAGYGVFGFFDRLYEILSEFNLAPRQVVCVWDGRNAKVVRQGWLPTYKAGREKDPDVFVQVNTAREAVREYLRELGATNVHQDGVEADDVIGYLAQNLRDGRNLIVTVDGDLAVLVDDNTDIWRQNKLNQNPYGPFPHKYITLYKSLVGDTSDNIPGAKGFGDGAWVDMIRIFGMDSLPEMLRLIEQGTLEELQENIADMPKLKTILENRATVINSWQCARLHIEKVNTMGSPLQIQAGMVKVGKPRPETLRFAHSYGTKTLVTAANFERVLQKFVAAVRNSPFVALDIETASTEASDIWLDEVNRELERKDGSGIDVLGHELVGMSLTFGNNTQHTIYMTVNHRDSDNITVEQCRRMVEAIPQDMHTVIQNRNFEFSVLYRTWGDAWQNNGWFGFVPNAIDTKIGASYVDENLPKGLKERSKLHLGYEQGTYEQTTTRSGPVGTLKGGTPVREYAHVLKPAVYEQVEEEFWDDDVGDYVTSTRNGKLLGAAVTEAWETRQYKMSELSAEEVFDYGCDDTICTAALHTYYKLVMDIEGTWNTYLEVEQLPEYLTSLAFVQGIRIDRARLRDMELRDDQKYEEAWAKLRGYLIQKGWDGTACPVFTEVTPSNVKLAAQIVLGEEFSTRCRKPNAIAKELLTAFPANDRAEYLASLVELGEVEGLNELVKRHFDGEPKINFGSPKQVQNLFYNVIGMTPRIFNPLTARERENPVLAAAFKKARDAKAGRNVIWKEGEKAILTCKASTDDSAVTSALALDGLGEQEREVLAAYQSIKAIQTRRNLFYKTYKAVPHWRDSRIHPNLNQCEAVTRRYSSSGPNVQQLPKGGDGGEFRRILLPHHSQAVVVSLDISGQELRLGAELSGDEAMTSCYVGDNLRDLHSLTAVAAAPLIWGHTVEYDEFMAMLESPDKGVKAKAKALRAQAKTVNFAAQYGGSASKISETLLVHEKTAQAFLDARAVAFPKIGQWSNKVAEDAARLGYASTMMGARRHLAKALKSGDSREASKAARQSGNFWIQGSSAEMTKLAMVRMWQSGVFASGQYDAKFYAPIHDEVVFSAHRDHALEVIDIVHRCMIDKYSDMKIPIVSSISLGPDFGHQTECGEEVNPETINAALKEIFDETK